MAILNSIFKPKTKTNKKAPKSAAADDPQVQVSLEELYAKIQQKAYELYEQRGRAPGYEAQDWLEAERLIEIEYKKVPAKK